MLYIFKKILCSIWCLFISLGYARAASALAREGRHDEAKSLMMYRDECDCFSR